MQWFPVCGDRRADRRLLVAAALVLLGSRAALAQPALTDPLPDPIVKGELTVALEPFVQAPRTEDTVPPSAGANDAAARIQYLLPVPGSDRLAFNDIRGVLYLTGPEGGEASVYLDLREQIVGFSNARFPNEAGFMGFAFHPNFVAAGQPGYGKLYTAFSATPESGVADFEERWDNVQESVVREWTAADPQAEVFRGTSREMLRVGQFAVNHNVGTIAFNPTAGESSEDFGLLYLGFGDGGGGYDPANAGQNLATPLGAILRIDPLDVAEPRGYGIPASNPFVGRPGAVEEIWAYGLRHPQQFSWDVDGRMFISDIGQDWIEEVNLGEAGGNYGWRLREGTFATGYEYRRWVRAVFPLPAADPPQYLYPLAQYDHDEGFAIGGGYVYRGAGIPYLRGKYVFTDFPRGRVFVFDADDAEAATPARIEELRLVVDGKEQDLVEVAGFPNTYQPGALRVDARVGIDHEGELYLLTKGDGWVRKLVAHGLGGADVASDYWSTRRNWVVCEDGSVVGRGEQCPSCDEDDEGCPAPSEGDGDAQAQ